MAKSDVAKERFFNLPVIVLISLSFMLGMSEFIVVGVLPDIAAGLKVSEVTVGNLVSLFAFVYAPVTPLGSALSARFPRFATHLTLVGVFLIGNVLCAFASNYGVLVVARILIALVSGTLVAIAMTYAPDVTTEQYRTKFIAWVFSGFSIASVVGVPVGTWVANTFGWRWAFHLVNVLTVVLIVLMVMVLPRNSRIVKIGFLPQFRLFFRPSYSVGRACRGVWRGGNLRVLYVSDADHARRSACSRTVFKRRPGDFRRGLPVEQPVWRQACRPWQGSGTTDAYSSDLLRARRAYGIADRNALGAGVWCVAAGGAWHVHVSAEFRLAGAIYGCCLSVASGIAESGRIAQFHVVQHRHRGRLRGWWTGQRPFGTDVAWPCGRDLPAVCGWHHNPAAPVRSSRTRFLRQTASLMAFGRV